MTTQLVTCSDASMSRSRALCARSAKNHGVDKAVECVLEPSSERGCGFWRWKSETILALMTGKDPFVTLRDGDILIYADAGVEFINNINYIIDRMDQPIFLFGNLYEHAHWCKADIINTVWPGSTWDDYGKQCQASVIVSRVCEYSKAFIREWLHWCTFEGGRLIDDSPSRAVNHEEFRDNRWDQAILTTIARREGVALHDWPASYSDGAATYPRGYLNRDHEKFEENRHDQAILTTMARREGLNLHWWPAIYNDGAFTYEKGQYKDDYPTLFHHHRRRNHEWSNVA